MANNKEKDAGITPDAPIPQAKKTTFRGRSVFRGFTPNNVSGKIMPSFQLEGDILPEFGDTITVLYGNKQKFTGVVCHTEPNGIFALSAV